MSDFIAQFLADPTISTIITAAAVGLIAIWLLSALWTHADAEHRTGSGVAALVAAGWVLLSTPLMLPLSMAVYALVRPGEPLAERRMREITAAMVVDSLAAESCAGCGSVVDASWRRCPTCTSWLSAPCAGCGRWSAVDLGACPWCGEIEREQSTVEDGADLDLAPPRLSGQPVPVMAPALSVASAAGPVDGVEGALRRSVFARSLASGRQSASGREGDTRATPRRARPSRPWPRRAPGGAARSLERDAAGGRSVAGSRS